MIETASIAPKKKINGLLDSYENVPGAFDEMWLPDGSIREEWKSFAENLQKLGGRELDKRYGELLRLLRENGVTYNIYNDPDGLNRPWQLDPVPLIVGEKDWGFLEAGMKQRAELLNFIITDIYGKRELFKNGLLPLELVYTHPGFLRECDQIKLPGNIQLPIYAADLVRGGNRRPWVINDRTQAPSGTGYALENRMTMGRILPDLFDKYQVRNITSFLTRFRNILSSLAPKQRDNPRIVVLTPGARNETYFEHSYLASYLGVTLVQGEDLMVRDNTLYLKSLSGLERVDVVLRRVDDSFCDPLELREDSQLGVPGLLNAIRKGNVVVVNPLGCSIIENPGLMAFLPEIARQYFGKELLLPSVGTWWCGQKKEMNYVIDNIDAFIIKRIYRINNKDSVIGALLSKVEKEALIAEIKTYPHLFVGQEPVNFSTSPLFINGALEPRYAVMRCYALGGNDGYGIMPGGLTRSSPEKGLFIISNQTGGISKDTWVLGKDTEAITDKQKEGNFSNPINQSDSLPSRTAENLFWVGRYAERTLYTARMLRTVLKTMNEAPKFSIQSDIDCKNNLFRALTHITMTYPGFVGEGGQSRLKNPENELFSVILSATRAGSLSFNLQFFIRACYAIRDQLALDTWRIVDTLEENWRTLQNSPNPNMREVQNGLDHLVTSLVAFLGLNNESMTRENAWLIMDIGRRIELGQMITSVIRATLVFKLDEFAEYAIQEAVLSSNESLITYRYRYRSLLKLNSVLDLLLLDEKNPRSLAFQVASLKRNLEALPKRSRNYQLTTEEKLALDAFAKLSLADTQQLSVSEGKFVRKDLDELMSKLSQILSDISLVVGQKFFSHALLQQQLGKSTV